MYEGYEYDYGTPVDAEGAVALYKEMRTPPIRWLIHEVMKEHGIGMLYGSSGDMKSYTAVDLACRMVNGMEFHGREMQQGNVIYIAGEAADETKERIDAWLEFHGKTERPLICPWAVQLHDSHQMRDLTTLIKRTDHVKLVIFDNLADCSVGVKLNDPDDVGEHIKPAVLSFVKQSRAAILMLHHTGHDNQDERGARVLRDMTDTSIRAKKQANNFDLEWTLKKVRRRQAGDKLYFHIKDISGVVGIENAAIILGGKRPALSRTVDAKTSEIIDDEPTTVIEFQSAAERLEAYLAEQGGDVNAREAQKALGWWDEASGKPSSTYYDVVNTLKDAGRIEREGRGKRARLRFPNATDASGKAA